MMAYIIKSIVFLSIMYIPYMLLLRKESFFHFNRLMLICIMILSLVLPLCNVHFLSMGNNPVNNQLQGVIEIGIPFATPLSQQEGNLVAESSSININWWSIVSLIYIIGMCVTVIWKLFQLTALYRQIHKGVLWTEKQDGVTIYCHANNIAPFSWFNTIAISEDDYRNNAREILRHEMGHIQNYHSIDILLVNIVQVIQWCNPLSWILANSLRDVHEYEADDAVLRSGVNAHQYQSLLIKKAVGSSSYAFANSFNHSLLKKRITMMLQKKSNPWMRSKALYILPVACIALSAFATPELNEQIESVINEKVESVSPAVNPDKVTKVSQIAQVSDDKNAVNDTIQKVAVVNPDGIIIRETKFGKGDPLFIIDGKESTRKDLKSLNPADVESIDVLKDSATVSAFGEKGKDGVILIKTKNAKATEPAFEVVDKQPEYKGGIPELMKFVAQNIRYPKEAQEFGLSGRVVLSFVIEKNGLVSEINVVNNGAMPKKEDYQSSDITVIGYASTEKEEAKPAFEEVEAAAKTLENEAIRVVKLSNGNWTPGEHKGNKVRVRYTIPITFRLQ